MKRLLMLMCLLQASAIIPMQEQTDQYNNLKKFVTKFSLPKDMSDALEKNKSKIDSFGLVLKGSDLSRIVNAEMIRKYITLKGYTHVDVPKKYLYDSTIVAEKIEKGTPEKISLTAAQELVDTVVALGFCDIYPENFIITKEAKIFFIDTEDNSFNPMINGPNSYVRKAKALQLLSCWESMLTNETKNWVKTEFEKNKKEYTEEVELPKIIEMSELKNNDEGIDYSTIKEDWKTLKELIKREKEEKIEKDLKNAALLSQNSFYRKLTLGFIGCGLGLGIFYLAYKQPSWFMGSIMGLITSFRFKFPFTR